MKNKPMIKYMHTIDGCPGYMDGEQICFAVRTRPIKLVGSLRDIQTEQKSTVKWRLSQGFEINASYGYVRVRV